MHLVAFIHAHMLVDDPGCAHQGSMHLVAFIHAHMLVDDPGCAHQASMHLVASTHAHMLVDDPGCVHQGSKGNNNRGVCHSIQAVLNGVCTVLCGQYLTGCVCVPSYLGDISRGCNVRFLFL